MDTEEIKQDDVQEAQQAEQSEAVAEPQDLQAAMFADTDGLPETADESEAQPESAGETDGADETANETQQAETPSDKAQTEAAPDDLAEPEGLGEKASARFQALANEVREFRAKEAEYVQMAETVNEFRRLAQESCNSGEEVLALFDYAKSVKTGDFDTAQRYLVEQIRQFEALSGRSLDAGLLGAYPDLQQQVDDMALSPDAARELAAGRFRQQREDEARQLWQRQQQEEEAARQADMLARQQGAQALNDLGDKWAREDVLWAEREPKVFAFARERLRDLPPQQWAGAVQMYYEGLRAAYVPRQPVSPPPLRTGQPGGGKAEPQDLMGAMFG